MGDHPKPRIGNPHQAGLPLAVERSTTPASVPKVGYAISRCPSSGAETPGSGGDIRGGSTAVLPISHIRSPQSAHRLEADPGRLYALNEYIVIPSFKMSNHASLRQALSPPVWLTSLDLKDAYLHVPIRQNLHKFLALSCWGKLFFFRALPFGLATAPWLFTMLMD